MQTLMSAVLVPSIFQVWCKKIWVKLDVKHTFPNYIPHKLEELSLASKEATLT